LENKKIKITVFGGGSWGTTLADILSERNYDVTLWVRDSEKAKIIEEKKKKISFIFKDIN
jgi:glycerol-3-phosphate dehydrogenase (NAD(P)+)